MSIKKDLRRLLIPYYWINILLSLSYIIAKKTTPLCKLLYSAKTECGELDMVRPYKSNVRINLNFDTIYCLQKESEILFFLLIVVVLRARKTGSVSMVSYLSSSFIYTKGANLILWFYSDTKLFIGYAVIITCKYL
jgi:hypothetical protein